MCAVGVPAKEVVDKLHKAKIPVMNMVGAPKHVKKALDVGVDLICAQGGEGESSSDTASRHGSNELCKAVDTPEMCQPHFSSLNVLQFARMQRAPCKLPATSNMLI